MILDIVLTDITALIAIVGAVVGPSIAILTFIYQRFQGRSDAKKLAENARLEAIRLTELAKEEAISVALKAQTARDAITDETRNRILALETRQDIIWDFLIRRSKAELVQRGWGKIKSPLQLTRDAEDCMKLLMPKMIPVYDAIMAATPDADERTLFIAFEAAFGDLLVEEICIPYNMTSGACVVAAIEMCKMTTKGGKHVETPATTSELPVG